jgi:hypothetical protein
MTYPRIRGPEAHSGQNSIMIRIRRLGLLEKTVDTREGGGTGIWTRTEYPRVTTEMAAKTVNGSS